MKKGIFSVSYAGFWGQDSLNIEEFINRAGSLGFDGVLLAAKRPHVSPVDTDEAAVERIATALEKAGVELIGLAAYTDYLVSAPAEVPIDQMQELYIDACARICKRLGGRVVRVFTGYDDGTPRSAQSNRVIGALRAAAAIAERHGVTLSVQNHHDIGVHTRDLQLLLDAAGSSALHAGYDAWSPHLRGEDLYSGARSMADRVFMTICADYLTIPRYRYEPELVNYRRIEPDAVQATRMGTGEIDYESFFKGLTDGGFDSDGNGWAVYEMCSPVVGGGSIKNLDAHARAFVEWIDARF